MAVCEVTKPKRRTLHEIRQDYRITDSDVCIFLDHFEDVPGRLVVEVGSHDESADAASIIAKAGQRVIGVDLREPNHAEAGQDYEYMRADFCDLPAGFIRTHAGRVDAIFSISAIEHFGLGAYQEKQARHYDIIAMRQMWQLLKPGGKAYITVPYGKRYSLVFPHWFVYDRQSVTERLVGDFHVEQVGFFTSAKAVIDGNLWPPNCSVTREQADAYEDIQHPHVTIFLKLVKQSVGRIAPDGR